MTPRERAKRLFDKVPGAVAASLAVALIEESIVAAINEERRACLGIVREKSEKLSALRNARLLRGDRDAADEIGALLIELGDVIEDIEKRDSLV